MEITVKFSLGHISKPLANELVFPEPIGSIELLLYHGGQSFCYFPGLLKYISVLWLKPLHFFDFIRKDRIN